MDGFAVGFASGIGAGMAIGVGTGMAMGGSGLSEALKKLADEGDIRVTNRDGQPLSGAQLLELLSSKRKKK